MTGIATAWTAATDQLATADEAFTAQEGLTPGGDQLDELSNAVTDDEDALLRTEAPHLQTAVRS